MAESDPNVQALLDLLEDVNLTSGNYSDVSSESESDEAPDSSSEQPEKICTSIEDVQELLREKKVKNVIVCTGAGISTSAGIPDFRTPGTGLYDNLEKYDLPYPEAVFDINYFKHSPGAFYALSTELLPGLYAPTIAHHFIKLLEDEGILRRCYSQNIDGLEGLTGLNPDKLVEAHGSFSASHCARCRLEISNDIIFPELRAGTPYKCPECARIGRESYVKPDIVFFGESLPDRFYQLSQDDFAECDLVIVIGTSLAVYPFAGLPTYVGKECPRLLINRELVGNFRHGKPDNVRDAFYCGNADDGCLLLADAMGKKEMVLNNQKKQADDIKNQNVQKPAPKKTESEKKVAKQKVIKKHKTVPNLDKDN
jgi:NAD-dependent deacetylase sirtuin 2